METRAIVRTRAPCLSDDARNTALTKRRTAVSQAHTYHIPTHTLAKTIYECALEDDTSIYFSSPPLLRKSDAVAYIETKYCNEEQKRSMGTMHKII